MKKATDKTLILPSRALTYNFHFHPRWAMGIHTDMIVETVVVKPDLGAIQKKRLNANRALRRPSLEATIGQLDAWPSHRQEIGWKVTLPFIFKNQPFTCFFNRLIKIFV